MRTYIKNKSIILRVSDNLRTKLHTVALEKNVSVSHLIREAVCKRYRIKDGVAKFTYGEARPGRPSKSSWKTEEIVALVKLYKPGVAGNKEKIAQRLGRSYWAIKHKINDLRLNEVA